MIYSFSCRIFRGIYQVVQYHKTLSNNGTFTSLREIEEYIKSCELRGLDSDDDEVWGIAYLPAPGVVDSPGVHEDQLEFQCIHIRQLSSTEPLMGCGPLHNRLRKKRCTYAILAKRMFTPVGEGGSGR